MKKYIPFDYLYSKANSFPFVYRLLYMKILDDAPIKMLDADKEDVFRDGYKTGASDGYNIGFHDACEAMRVNSTPKRSVRRSIK